MQNLKITLVQSPLHWENPAANKQLFLESWSFSESTDLIVLPEMFTTGFSMETSLAREAGDTALEICRTLSEKTGAAVCGSSMFVKEDGQFVNRLIFWKPGGTPEFYDKKHLFTLAAESVHFTAGNSRLIVEWKGWKICPLICYDLRFPVWSARTTEHNYDLLLYTANWAERRSLAWRQLLRARAVENQCYVVGINRVGKDGNGMMYAGDSVVLDYGGRYVKKIRPFLTCQETVELNADSLESFREKLPFFRDQDEFELKK
jgi:omega-amidase